MKTTIMYYYNIENPTIYISKEKKYIKTKNSRYIIQPIQSEEDVNEIYNILINSKEIAQYYKIVPTKNKKLHFIHNGLKFVIIEINKDIKNFEMQITKTISLPYKNYKLDRSNWYFLWSRKSDYIYNQSKVLNKKYSIANEAMEYYIGMAETAISYLKNNTEIYKESKRLSLCHNRVNDEEIKNPINIVVDSKERDISEYLKYLFLEKKQNIEKTRKVITIANLKDEESLLRLYARMLYPSYFFDIYERIINQCDKEEKIINIVKRIDEYECYLREIYNEINKIYSIKKIDWI